MYKDDICFRIDTSLTYMEEVTPRVLYVDPLGYEKIEDKIEGYAHEILKLELKSIFGRLGTYEENMQLAYQAKLKNSKNNRVDGAMKKIMEEEHITPQEFTIVRNIVSRMKKIGQENILFAPPLVVVSGN